MATTWNNEPPSQGAGDGGNPPPPPAAQMPEPAASRAGNKVFKSGPLFISSKGIGWTSWKKRWFILTRTSLVFFRSDPNAVPQRGSEVNLTLGGIDLNNSGSVVVKTDKKLLTVLFPDGRAFTLKAETMDDLYEWKNALEAALAQAPSPTLVMGQNGIFRNDPAGAIDGSMEQQLKDKQNMKSVVVGRPILLALEEVDGTPSFLEKALRFIEDHGAKVEGILRQAADVDDVEHRIREYEQGKTDFSPEEDAHVIGDCIKYVIRELLSSPVPASCCNALLETCRTDRERRVTAMRMAICETFPEPNRRLLQRILIMMQKVAAQKAVNRMSPSAVAACMAPLLLRPLLAGDCELEHDFDVGGDGSAQLLQAAAAANHAQSIVITLLEEYDNIFGEGSLSPDIYSDSDDSGSEGEEVTDDEYYEDDDEYDEDDEDDEDDSEEEEESGLETDDEMENVSGESRSESGDDEQGSTVHTKKVGYDGSSTTSGSESPEVIDDLKVAPLSENDKPKTIEKPRDTNSSAESLRSIPIEEAGQSQNSAAARNTIQKSTTIASGTDPADIISDKQKSSSGHHHPPPSSSMNKSTTIASGTLNNGRRQIWGRTPARKNLSMESIGDVFEEDEIQKLEAAKADLEAKIAEEAKENEVLLADLENQKKALVERRQALEKDVAKLEAQLQKERDLRRALEAALKEPHNAAPYAATIDRKVKADLEELAAAELDIHDLKKKVDDLGNQLNKQREENSAAASQQSETKQAKSQPPTRQLDSVRSKKHQQPRRQLDSLGSKKHQPPSQQVDPAGSSNKQEQPSQQQESVGTNKQPPLSQHLDSVGSSKSKHNGGQLGNAQASDTGSGQGALSPDKSRGAEAQSAQKSATSSSEGKVHEASDSPSNPENRAKVLSEGQSSSQNVDRNKE